THARRGGHDTCRARGSTRRIGRRHRVVTTAGFDRLHSALRYHVVNSLEWPALRPMQDAAVAPIIAGADCLILAPTAGGKTEAAIIPVLSRMLSEDWRGLSVLYVCPIKALINNL